jgi:coenzyme F420-dependent glucose-6-phosphate dehydrogenase
MTRYFVALGHERFPPDELLQQAVAAEQAGFDGIVCSDHFQPWWDESTAPANSGQAWAWLGAAGALTERAQLGTAVLPIVHRYHPAVVAQFFATMEVMFPGRTFFGVGSGEALNEVPCGMDWPSGEVQLERMTEALGIVDRLLDGERVTFDGSYFRTNAAYLWTRPERRPPIVVSAFHPEAAKLAGRLGDGIWSLADPETVPDLIEAYEEGCKDAGKERGEIVLHAPFSWAESDEAALEGAREWKATVPDEFYVDDWHDPAAMIKHAEETVSDEEFAQSAILSADPAEHVQRIREVEELGATTVVLMNVSGKDPLAALKVYGEQVLPKLRS